MTHREIRGKFLKFFEKRGHKIIPSASLLPENDPSTLFITAGMQPLVPYLLGEKHPKGPKLVNVQKVLRTKDIEEVGDKTHLTFFEMLGNWSLGDYWKKEAISWSYELLMSKEEGFGLDPKRLYVTVFAGDENAPRDEESFEIWKSVGAPENRIYFRGAKDNWWSPGDNGPCGPDTEMFYDVTGTLGDLAPEQFERAEAEQKVVEIWNDVFIEYEKKNGKVVGKLKQQNVDTGAGLERLAVVLQDKDNIYETDLFEPILRVLPAGAEHSRRVIADHIRAALFLAADGVSVSNIGRGYVLRRLIRRAVRHARELRMKLDANTFRDVENKIFDMFKQTEYFKDREYLERETEARARGAIDEEVMQFQKTLERGLKEFEKLSGDGISGREAFNLYQTYGFPFELTNELALEKGVAVDAVEFRNELEKHQEKSRTAGAGKFKGGLGDTSEKTIRLHTAHHLLLAALQKILGKEVKQRGSNITPERLRIDFSFERKLTEEEKKQVENQVNEWIKKGFAVVKKEMPREEAEKSGAEMEFGQKYPDIVSVFFIKDKDGAVISKEFCGGPHVKNTSELLRAGGRFIIKKEEASSAGIRRIKAILN